MRLDETLVSKLYYGLALPNTVSQLLGLEVSICGSYFDEIKDGDLKDVRFSFDIDEDKVLPENLLALKPFEGDSKIVTIDAIGNRIANLVVFKLFMNFEDRNRKEHFVELPGFVVRYNMVNEQFTY